jgi:hypothetical protein
VAAFSAMGIFVACLVLSGGGVCRADAEGAEVSKTKHKNRLGGSTSPYLLQHADNPVNWYPWGEEALARARKEDKPLLVSIGYSSCHWCHVMERESFENEEIAAVMNANFICIKIDREERPDLDEIYVNAVAMMTGSAGWPLNVFLTPDLKPFFGGTYFPPEDRFSRPGFKRVLLYVADLYKNHRDQVDDAAKRVGEALKALAPETPLVENLNREVITAAVRELAGTFDSKEGGFGSAPKFPRASTLTLLLRYHYHTGDAEALRMATLTLEKMARGGMYDQLGGGFHRYSVDAEWLVPHFEKMLYDNALLAVIYIEAWQLTRKPLYGRVAREILDYVLRDMVDEGGGFHSAQDADTEGEEGKYYAWRAEEIDKILPAADAKLFKEYYGVTAEGIAGGNNILHIETGPEAFAKRLKMKPVDLQRRIDKMRRALLAVRRKRARPGKDDKVLADWNGLMVSAFARAHQVFGNKEYRVAAERAADFILTRMRGKGGGLLHAHRAGRSHLDAYLDDYVFVIQGLLDLYEATFDVKWLGASRDLADAMIKRFWDSKRGGFFFTEAGKSDIITRSKRSYDSAIPAGGAVAVRVLVRLAILTGETSYRDKAEGTLKVLLGNVKRSPSQFAALLSSLAFYLGPVKEIAISGDPADKATRALLKAVHGRFLPNKVVALVDPASANADEVAKAVPLLREKGLIGGKPAAYVCENYQCKLPVNSVGALEKVLESK